MNIIKAFVLRKTIWNEKLYFRKPLITWIRIAVAKFWTTDGSKKRY